MKITVRSKSFFDNDESVKEEMEQLRERVVFDRLSGITYSNMAYKLELERLEEVAELKNRVIYR